MIDFESGVVANWHAATDCEQIVRMEMRISHAV